MIMAHFHSPPPPSTVSPPTAASPPPTAAPSSIFHAAKPPGCSLLPLMIGYLDAGGPLPTFPIRLGRQMLGHLSEIIMRQELEGLRVNYGG